MKKSEIDWWLSVATGPVVLTYLAIKSLSHTLQEIGQASEEIFRGDRLPLLNFPEDKQEGQP